MDNVFEILIYLIIIISFLSSIFKKKKQQQQQKPPVRQPQAEEYYQTETAEVTTPPSQQKVEYDILKELEDFFKVGDEQTQMRIPPISQEQSRQQIPAEEKLSESWRTKTESEHYVEDWERKKAEVKKRTSRVDSGVEKKAALFEESLVKKEAVYSGLALTVKSKIENPSTLKEYIIFSEILGKPKALRR
ncbi:MAG: hypothetical protein IH618_07425 [Ignavibacteriaceae bacterium]|nr:hypothetical protein [Ignavibacteriaceae bacterium]